MQQPQVREHVEHLLLREVPAARRPVRRQADGAQLLLEHLRIGARSEEEHDLPGRRLSHVAELPHAPSGGTCFTTTPVAARLLVASLVVDEQLDGRALGGIGEAARGHERLVALPEVCGEELVHDIEQLRPRAVVRAQRQHALRLGTTLPEDLQVRVPEPVDGLELVPHEEELFRIELVDDLALEPVRVLELVDHDRPEAKALAAPHRLVLREEIAGAELEILEVERALRVLRALVRVVEEREQLLQQVPVADRSDVERRLLQREPQVLVRGEAILAAALDRDLGQVEQEVDMRLAVQQLDGASEDCARVVRPGLAVRLRECPRRGCSQLRDPLVELRLLLEAELERPAGCPQRLRDPAEHATQADRAVRREQLDPLWMLVRAEFRQRDAERLRTQHARLALVEHAEARIDACRRGIRPEQPVAEAVDRRDPRAVELPCEIGATGLKEPCPDARPELARRALGERHDEDRADVDATLDGPDEPFDDDSRLARAGARRDEHRPAGVDGDGLLRVRGLGLGDGAHGRLTRQMGPRSHHDGHEPPFGSCRTCPSRMRPTEPRARSAAWSTSAQNASSSR